MNGMRCGRVSGTCGARCMTGARLGLLGLGRLVVIVLAWFNSLVMCFDYSTGQHTVNGGASVMIRLRLHLTRSGGGQEGGLGREEKKF